MSADDLRAKLSAPAPEARMTPLIGAKPDPAPVVVQPDIQALPCTGCVIDAKQAAMLGKDAPEPLPGTVMVNGMLLCDVRHTLNVGSPQLLIAQPGQVPGGLG